MLSYPAGAGLASSTTRLIREVERDMRRQKLPHKSLVAVPE